MGDEFEYEKSIESSTLVTSKYKTILHLPTIKKEIAKKPIHGITRSSVA